MRFEIVFMEEKNLLVVDYKTLIYLTLEYCKEVSLVVDRAAYLCLSQHLLSLYKDPKEFNPEAIISPLSEYFDYVMVNVKWSHFGLKRSTDGHVYYKSKLAPMSKEWEIFGDETVCATYLNQGEEAKIKFRYRWREGLPRPGKYFVYIHVYDEAGSEGADKYEKVIEIY